MDLLFRANAVESEGEWFGVVLVAEVEVWRSTVGQDTRGKAQVAVKDEFVEVLRVALAYADLQEP